MKGLQEFSAAVRSNVAAHSKKRDHFFPRDAAEAPARQFPLGYVERCVREFAESSEPARLWLCPCGCLGEAVFVPTNDGRVAFAPTVTSRRDCFPVYKIRTAMDAYHILQSDDHPVLEKYMLKSWLDGGLLASLLAITMDPNQVVN